MATTNHNNTTQSTSPSSRGQLGLSNAEMAMSTQLPTNHSTRASLCYGLNVAELSSIQLPLGQQAVPQGGHGPAVDL